MPKIIKTAQDYQSKNFQVLGIAQPIDPIESVHQYVKDYGLPFTVMYDADKTAAKAFGTQVYPTSVLIDKNGNILKPTLVNLISPNSIKKSTKPSPNKSKAV